MQGSYNTSSDRTVPALKYTQTYVCKLLFAAWPCNCRGFCFHQHRSDTLHNDTNVYVLFGESWSDGFKCTVILAKATTKKNTKTVTIVRPESVKGQKEGGGQIAAGSGCHLVSDCYGSAMQQVRELKLNPIS